MPQAATTVRRNHFLRFVLAGPKSHEIRVHGGIDDQPSHIRKDKTGATFDDMRHCELGTIRLA